MAEFLLPELSIRTESANEDIKSLLKIIKSTWDNEKIVIKALTGGYSCSTYFCHQEGNSNDGVTVRVRRILSFESTPLINRQFEEKVVQVMSDLGIMAKIHAIFENGYCYQYIRGKPLFNATEASQDPQNVPDFSKFPIDLIARKMAKIHSVKIEGEDYTKTTFFEKLLDTLELYPDDPILGLPDKQQLSKLLKELISIGEKLNCKVGLCHGDPHAGNMVYDADEGKLTFVDWELTSIGYFAFDVGYFLRLFTFGDIVPFPGAQKIPQEDIDKLEKHFIASYLKSCYELENGSSNSDEEFDEFSKHVQFFSLVWAIYMIIILGPIYRKMQDSNSPLPIDPREMMNLIFQNYISVKDEKLQQLGLK